MFMKLKYSYIYLIPFLYKRPINPLAVNNVLCLKLILSNWHGAIHPLPFCDITNSQNIISYTVSTY